MLAATSRIIYHLLILSIAIALSTSRPQAASSETQDGIEYQANFPDPASYFSYPSPIILDNPSTMDRLQMLLAQQARPKYSKNYSSGSWNTLYRLPESKRQVRYRQCYFNPISCFRK